MLTEFSRTMFSVVLLLASCIPQENGPAVSPVAELVIEENEDLILPGTDQAPYLHIAWRDSRGHRQPISWTHNILSALAWQESAIIVDDQRQLWRLSRDGRRERLGTDVFGNPRLSPSGEILAYRVRRPQGGEVRIRRPLGGPRIIARDLQSAGPLRFSSDEQYLFFIGSRQGGVAGLWVANTASPGAEALCLTNCELRTGTPWEEKFLPSPRSLDHLRTAGRTLFWEVEGQRYSVSLPSGAIL